MLLPESDEFSPISIPPAALDIVLTAPAVIVDVLPIRIPPSASLLINISETASRSAFSPIETTPEFSFEMVKLFPEIFEPAPISIPPPAEVICVLPPAVTEEALPN